MITTVTNDFIFNILFKQSQNKLSCTFNIRRTMRRGYGYHETSDSFEYRKKIPT